MWKRASKERRRLARRIRPAGSAWRRGTRWRS
ncbi:unnamed protein product [Linum tenue]|uniref:Uncharacterized protein n=1 Tax=Linum tenue TaxID=586396 RepID=A0AAV0KSR9_9ROSI|nr:unnamed protein product [Linum tenue]